MWVVAILGLWLLNLCIADEEKRRGFPFYYGSFEDVGASRTLGDVVPAKVVDNQITEWTKDCPADAFVLIDDDNLFQLGGLRKMQRAAENSLTTGSFLTKTPVELRELGLDLEEYCEGELIDVQTDNLESLPKSADTKTRIYYIRFAQGTSVDVKNETLTAVLAVIPSPFVTISYVSHVPQSQPILRSIKPNPKRQSWQRQKLRHNRQKIAPVIAPLFDRKGVGHSAPEARIDLPDNFFFTLLVGSVFAVAFLAYRDLTGQKKDQQQSKKAAPAPAASAETRKVR